MNFEALNYRGIAEQFIIFIEENEDVIGTKIPEWNKSILYSAETTLYDGIRNLEITCAGYKNAEIISSLTCCINFLKHCYIKSVAMTAKEILTHVENFVEKTENYNFVKKLTLDFAADMCYNDSDLKFPLT